MTRYCRPQRTRPGPGETLTPTTVGENSGDKYANRGELQLTLFYLLCLSVGYVCTPEPLVYCRLLASAQRPAARLPHRMLPRKREAVLLQRNPGAVCLPRRRSCCRARWEISCSALERRHLLPTAVLRCRFKESSAPTSFSEATAPPAAKTRQPPLLLKSRYKSRCIRVYLLKYCT